MPASALRIVFMGTPDFAVPSLAALLNSGCHLAGVITAPDKPSGRGLKMSSSPVKEFALRHGIPVLQPVNLKDPEFIEALKALKPDLQVVVAFRMLPEMVWQLPEKGTFNLHASLLPQYRGAAPINWAIINGDKETGVTTFFLKQEIDTGEIIYQETVPIGPDETAGELHDRLMHAGAALVVKTVNAIGTGQAISHPQQESSPLHPAPKLNKLNTRIHPDRSVASLHNFIRGLSPYPAAHATFRQKHTSRSIDYKVFKSRAVEIVHAHMPGSIATDHKSFIHLYTPDGYVDLLELQLAGKQRMDVKQLLNGFRMEGEWESV